MNAIAVRTAMLVAMLCTAPEAYTQAQVLAERPTLRVGDSWSYLVRNIVTKDESSYTREITAKNENDYATKVTNERAGSSTVVMSRITLDLNRLRTVDGRDSDAGWFSFPLAQGKGWTAKDYRSNSRNEVLYDDLKYTVIGKERITVPAGTFETIKVEGTGRWYNTAPTARTSNTVAVAIWYSPELKNYVRIQIQRWGDRARGVETEFVDELVGAKVGTGESIVAYGRNVGEPGTIAAK